MSQPAEHDEILNEIATVLRTLTAAASRFAEVRARRREQQLRDATARSEQQRRETTARIDSQQRMAEASLRQVFQEQWWNDADPLKFANAYRASREWSDRSPVASTARDHMESQFKDRYNLEVRALYDEHNHIEQLLNDAQKDRDGASTNQQSSDREAAAVRALLADADREDRAAEREDPAEWAQHRVELEDQLAGWGLDDGIPPPSDQEVAYVQEQIANYDALLDNNDPAQTPEAGAHLDQASADRVAADVGYDSTQRRAGTARALLAQGIGTEAVAARMSADQDQAHPATQAVANGPQRAPKARKGRPGSNHNRQREQGR
ncbi:hypothetical protein [Williamsia sp.]|uniref:hypothetical protein n=1 Tax=Williamsia sp. TaxID=1872085 RepID=UPI001A19AB21|nr:hypothetical protein [Williamsia sp.]MBJ7287571.1 hypothetical protein [Williamsia sp.]